VKKEKAKPNQRHQNRRKKPPEPKKQCWREGTSQKKSQFRAKDVEFRSKAEGKNLAEKEWEQKEGTNDYRSARLRPRQDPIATYERIEKKKKRSPNTSRRHARKENCRGKKSCSRKYTQA